MKRKMVIPLILIYLIMGIIIMNLVKSDYYVEIKDYNFTTEAQQEEVLDLTEERVFAFENPLLHVENLILKFSGCGNLTDGWMYVKVYDEEREYYTYEVPVYAFSGDEFYLYTNEITGLQIGEQYALSVSVTDKASEKIKLHCTKEMAFASSLQGEEGGLSPIWGASGRERYTTTEIYKWLVIGMGITLLYGCVVYLWHTKKNFGKVVCLMLLVIAVMAGFLYGNRLTIETPVEYWVCPQAKEFEDIPLQKGVEQRFIAEHASLQEFILFFENYSSQEKATAQVTLCDVEGECYYQWEAPIEALGGDVFCLVGTLQKELQKGKEYYIRALLMEGESSITVRAVRESDIRDSIGEMLVAGEEAETRLYLHQDYIRKDSYLLIWGLVLGATLILILMLDRCSKTKWMNPWYGLCEVFLILAGYYIIESLSGNIRFVEASNALKNCILLSCIYWLLKAVFLHKAYYLMGILVLLTGLANFYVLEFRGTELLYTDISSFFTAMSVVKNYKFVFPPAVFTALLIIACLFMLRFSVGKKYHKVHFLKGIVTRITCLVASIVIVLVMGNTLNRAAFDFFSLNNSFRKFGWCYTNLYLMKFSDVDKPEGYSEKEVERIIQEVAGMEFPREEIVPENIIVIMNESLADLQDLGNLETNQDYMPYIRSLEENVVQGELYVPTFGGGTSLTEYEFLTGNLQHFLPNSTVPYSSLCEEREEGICRTLKVQGYHTVAMHPYDPTNWNRNEVYPALGFDEFLALDDYEGAETIRSFVSDRACYEKIIDYYENMDREGGLFCFNVTMQNHGGYDSLNGTLEGEITIDNFESKEAETYLSLIYESDKAFEYLLSYFEQVEEPTMILMFGDHLPALSDDFYEYLYGKDMEERSLEEKSELFATPYILWTNYESDFEEIPQMSVNYLGSYLLQCAGVDMPLYNRFLLKYQEEVPVLGAYGVLDETGKWTQYKEVEEEVLKDYKILQYMRVEDRKSLLYSVFQTD